jgi:hypothetical protein
MIRLRFVRLLAVVLAITMILWLTPSAHSTPPFTITLMPNTGAAGTSITIAGSDSDISAPPLDQSCMVSSVPDGLISNPVCTVTQPGDGDGGPFTVSGSFTVASGASPGPYTVTVTVTIAPQPVAYTSASASFTVPAAPIPEYSYGLSVLAVFMVLAYAVIKRRTRN